MKAFAKVTKDICKNLISGHVFLRLCIVFHWKCVEFAEFANSSKFTDLMNFAYVVFCLYFRKKIHICITICIFIKMQIFAKTHIFQFCELCPTVFHKKILLPPQNRIFGDTGSEIVWGKKETARKKGGNAHNKENAVLTMFCAIIPT